MSISDRHSKRYIALKVMYFGKRYIIWPLFFSYSLNFFPFPHAQQHTMFNITCSRHDIAPALPIPGLGIPLND